TAGPRSSGPPRAGRCGCPSSPPGRRSEPVPARAILPCRTPFLVKVRRTTESASPGIAVVVRGRFYAPGGRPQGVSLPIREKSEFVDETEKKLLTSKITVLDCSC